MLNLDLLANGDSRRVNQDAIHRAMQGLNKSRKEFISSCLETDPSQRVTAFTLMKSKVLQEVWHLDFQSVVFSFVFVESAFLYYFAVLAVSPELFCVGVHSDCAECSGSQPESVAGRY